MRKKYLGWILLGLCTVCAAGDFSGHGAKEAVGMIIVEAKAESTEAADAGEKSEENTSASNAAEVTKGDADVIISAIQRSSRLPSFQIDTTVNANLNGKVIRAEYNLQSDIHVVQDAAGEKLQMTMVNTSGTGEEDSEVSEAYYKDGWYYSRDSKGNLKKTEKSSEEVMEMVTSITDMVTNASGQVEILKKETDGENTKYTYRIPNYLAEEYLDTMSESQIAEDTALENVTASVESLQLVSTIAPEGLLVRQELELSGAVKKLLFKVPVDVTATAEFQPMQETELEIPLWEEK
ncbi:MAG: hypothetical protein PHR92_12560 [Lachnospiraceae bacterium]|nr:hypothetical protein [Lachnospiraceae bacterium]